MSPEDAIEALGEDLDLPMHGGGKDNDDDEDDDSDSDDNESILQRRVYADRQVELRSRSEEEQDEREGRRGRRGIRSGLRRRLRRPGEQDVSSRRPNVRGSGGLRGGGRDVAVVVVVVVGREGRRRRRERGGRRGRRADRARSGAAELYSLSIDRRPASRCYATG